MEKLNEAYSASSVVKEFSMSTCTIISKRSCVLVYETRWVKEAAANAREADTIAVNAEEGEDGEDAPQRNYVTFLHPDLAQGIKCKASSMVLL